VSGFVVAGLMAVVIFAGVSRLRVHWRVMAVSPGSGRESLVRSPEEPVADEDRHHEEGGREPAGCHQEGDAGTSVQDATV